MLAALLVPTASQCLSVAWPLIALGVAVWFWRDGDELIARLFPHWGWEQDLGWLNIKSHRHADRIVRAATHLLHVLLLVALCGILFISWLFGQPLDFDDKAVALGMLIAWFYLFFCYGIWIYYLGFVLYPRIRDEFDAEELDRYRLEHPDPDEEDERVMKGRIAGQGFQRPRRF